MGQWGCRHVVFSDFTNRLRAAGYTNNLAAPAAVTGGGLVGNARRLPVGGDDPTSPPTHFEGSAALDRPRLALRSGEVTLRKFDLVKPRVTRNRLFFELSGRRQRLKKERANCQRSGASSAAIGNISEVARPISPRPRRDTAGTGANGYRGGATSRQNGSTLPHFL